MLLARASKKTKLSEAAAEDAERKDTRKVSHAARQRMRLLLTSKCRTRNAVPDLDHLGRILSRRPKGQLLDEKELCMALRVVLQCKREQQRGAKVTTAQPFLRASLMTGVAECTLREKWEEFEKSELVPPVLHLPRGRGVTPNARVLGQEDLVAVQQELQERHAAGTTVVLAHIRQFLIQNFARSKELRKYCQDNGILHDPRNWPHGDTKAVLIEKTTGWQLRE